MVKREDIILEDLLMSSAKMRAVMAYYKLSGRELASKVGLDSSTVSLALNHSSSKRYVKQRAMMTVYLQELARRCDEAIV